MNLALETASRGGDPVITNVVFFFFKYRRERYERSHYDLEYLFVEEFMYFVKMIMNTIKDK